ncbi:DUF2188 domain-containing protein [Oceanidesulfovibrio marinus]|uniref:DUF2188 domain-containing protein n=1 Tax=Oceanidesulfovibrio marinus TaxID=370038 RepID=A0ABX6NIC8_9BACT|nr:DUF2188 domain-containing protein [Oceanidesulfovibrio marinus]QJT10342.1 DUF2188 domain-containing protein [Oceanidesulfovibrio marinus]
MSRKKVHVTKAGKKWKVQSEDAGRADSYHDRKEDAVNRGKDIAKNAPLGQIIIHKGDGEFQTEHTYGNDPERYKG